MENLKIEGIFPSSISQISYANEESEFGGYSITYQKPHQFEKINDYQIKINAPDSKEPQVYDQRPAKYNVNHQSTFQDNMMPKPDKIEYKDKITGYDINKDALSEEQLMKAFKIIDISKDDVISEEDLVFILDYIKEDYTIEEVREMITLLSSDKKHVSFEDFKKLGRGEIIPLANYKLPDSKNKIKSQILDNVERSELISEDPKQLIEFISKGGASYSKFQQLKKGPKKTPTLTSKKIFEEIKLFKVVPLLTIEKFQQRKQLFMTTIVSNAKDLIKNFQELKDQPLGLQEIAKNLEITLKEVNQLYPGVNEAEEVLVTMQTIAYSRLSFLKRLEMCLQVVNCKESITFKQFAYILQILKGKDGSIEKKLKAMYKSKEMDPAIEISKIDAVEIIAEFINVFVY